MAVPSWTPLPPRYRDTRIALHTVAEHILAAARYRAVGRIGLQPVRGGFGTPLVDGRWIEVIGTDLVVRAETGEVQREPITTLRSAGTFVGIEPGLPSGIYPPVTPLDLDAGLEVDPDAAAAIADWFSLTIDALGAFAGEHHDEAPSDATLWPEHFDLGLSVAEVNYGGSPGDDGHDEPYIYVGPWTARKGPFWNEDFGATRSGPSITNVAGALAFLTEGHARAAEDPTR
jgi:hypothetical protein